VRARFAREVGRASPLPGARARYPQRRLCYHRANRRWRQRLRAGAKGRFGPRARPPSAVAPLCATAQKTGRPSRSPARHALRPPRSIASATRGEGGARGETAGRRVELSRLRPLTPKLTVSQFRLERVAFGYARLCFFGSEGAEGGRDLRALSWQSRGSARCAPTWTSSDRTRLRLVRGRSTSSTGRGSAGRPAARSDGPSPFLLAGQQKNKADDAPGAPSAEKTCDVATAPRRASRRDRGRTQRRTCRGHRASRSERRPAASASRR
jgi:hypothetical protein